MIRKAHVTFDSLNFGEYGGEINGEDAVSSLAPRDEDGDIDDDLADTIWDSFHDAFQSFDEEYHSQNACVYCGCAVDFVDAIKQNSKDEKRWIDLRWCDNCRAWAARSSFSEASDDWGNTAMMSKARTFAPTLPRPCAIEVAQFLRRKPDYFHSIDPHLLEHFVADVFRANYRQSEVMHVGRPGDGGTDVVFVDSGRTEWLIQVKRRSSPRKAEPFSTIRDLAGTLTIEGKLHGMRMPVKA